MSETCEHDWRTVLPTLDRWDSSRACSKCGVVEHMRSRPHPEGGVEIITTFRSPRVKFEPYDPKLYDDDG